MSWMGSSPNPWAKICKNSQTKSNNAEFFLISLHVSDRKEKYR